MRFIKRFIFVILLLVIAFFIYRLISPTAAKELLFDLKSFSNDKIGTHFSLSGEILETTGTVLNTTGVVLQDTGILQEFTGDEQLLLNDSELSQESFDTGILETGITTTTSVLPTSAPVTPPTVTTIPKTTTKTTTKTTSSSSNGLSAQDIRDLKTLFGN